MSHRSRNIITSGAASSVGAILILGVYFYTLNISYSGPRIDKFPSISSFIFASLACLVVYGIATVFTYLFSKYLEKLLPLWLSISFLGSVSYVIAVTVYVQSMTIAAYKPGNPWSEKPPELGDVAVSVTLMFILFVATTSILSKLVLTVIGNDEDRNSVAAEELQLASSCVENVPCMCPAFFKAQWPFSRITWCEPFLVLAPGFGEFCSEFIDTI